MLTLSDAQARQRALDTQASFAVSAPAGSGKTGLLTQRILALLGQCQEPEEVLAITFTNKAASEMQTRVIEALRYAQEQEQAPDDDFSQTTWSLAKNVLARNDALKWNLFNTPNRLQITTIDSFCRRLSQQTPLSNDLGYTPDILEQADIAYSLAARETLKLLEKDHPIAEQVAKLIQHFNNQLGTLEQLFCSMLARREQWLPIIYSAKEQRALLEQSLKNVIDQHLQHTQKSLQIYAPELIPLAQFAAKSLRENQLDSVINACETLDELPPANHKFLTQWLGLAEILLTKTGEARKTVTKNQGFFAGAKTDSKEVKAEKKIKKEAILELINELSSQQTLIENMALIRQLPSAEYPEKQWQILESLTQILPILAAQLKLVFQQLGKVDYNEITLNALDGLGEEQHPTDLSLILDYKIHHILIDEFQDTSAIQLALLKKLTSGWQSGDGRTLFVVGDAMQSCYGFRNANVGIFLNLKQQGLENISLETINLSTNFRSQKPLVNWFNNIFDKLFPQEDAINYGAVKYNEAVALKDDSNSEGIHTHFFVGESNDEAKSAEADKICQQIALQQKQSPLSSIAILVRNRNQAAPIIKKLNEHQILYTATEIDRLAKQRAIQDCVLLTRALLHPDDYVSWLSMLRAPWCGLDMFDLYYLVKQNQEDGKPLLASLLSDEINTDKLSEDGKTILLAFSQKIKTIYQRQYRGSLRSWITHAWISLGGSALFLSPEEIDHSHVFFDLLEKHSTGGSIEDWSVFLNAIDALFSNATNQATTSDQAPVNILTIHKSKGLEFDTVFIPGIEKNNPADKQELLLWAEQFTQDNQLQLIISPVHAKGDDKDTIYSYIQDIIRKKQLFESERVFYIACTRAKKCLHISGHIKQAPETFEARQDTLKPRQNILTKLWPLVYERSHFYLLTAKSDINNELYAEDIHPSTILRTAKGWQQPKLPANNLLAAYRLVHFSEPLSYLSNVNTPTELRQRNARYQGTLLHETIQQIILTDYRTWNNERIVQLKALWAVRLKQLGMEQTNIQSAITKTSTIITKMLGSQVGQWLLDHSHEQSHCEYSLWAPGGNEYKRYIIDRTFIDKRDSEPVRWIIDYKSSEPTEGQARANFIQQEKAKHSDQLKRYQQLFPQSHPPIKLGLFLPSIDHLAEIDA